MGRRWKARWIPEVIETDAGDGKTELTVEYLPAVPEREIEFFQWEKPKLKRKKSRLHKAIIIGMATLPLLYGVMYSALFLKHDIAYIVWMAIWITFDILVVEANFKRRKR